MDDAQVWRLIARLAAEHKTLDTAAIAARVPPSRRKARDRALIRAWMVIGRLRHGLDPDLGSLRRGMRICVGCGKGFHATRSDARYCSSTCRVQAYRSRQLAQRL